MKTEAVAAFRPCGCLDEIYDPEHCNWRGTDFLEAIGFRWELMHDDAAEAIPYVECEHGDMQQQLAALVKKQAGEIWILAAQVRTYRADALTAWQNGYDSCLNDTRAK